MYILIALLCTRLYLFMFNFFSIFFIWWHYVVTSFRYLKHSALLFVMLYLCRRTECIMFETSKFVTIINDDLISPKIFVKIILKLKFSVIFMRLKKIYIYTYDVFVFSNSLFCKYIMTHSRIVIFKKTSCSLFGFVIMVLL